MIKKLRWQILIGFLALVAIAALLTIKQPETAEQQASEIQPAVGGIYTEAIVGNLGRLNPLLGIYQSADGDVGRLLFSGLIRFDDRGLPQGDLAESWGVSQDATVYNFSIRPQAVWHDGEPVTSQDVVFTIGLIQNDDFPFPDDLRQFWQEIEVIDIDEKTVQFRLPEPFAPFLDYLTVGLLPEHTLGQLEPAEILDDQYNLHPIGTGPYAFDHLLVNEGEIQGVVLSAFGDYYLGHPFIDQIVIRYYPDARAAWMAYQEGEVTGISQITPEILSDALNEPELNIYSGRLPRLSLVYLNLDNQELPFFQEADIRKALLMGLNRQWMIDHILGGQGMIADGPIFPGTWAYYQEIERVPYDPQAALDLIKKTGYTIPADGGNVRVKDDTAFSFELAYPDDEKHQMIAEMMQEAWGKLGIEVQLTAVDYETLLSDYLEPRRYEAVLVDLNLTRSPDPDPYPFWAQGQITGGQNYAKWNDRQASEYLERARITVDVNERAKAYRNFQVRFSQEMPALPLYYPVYTLGIDQQVQGVRIGSFFDTSDRFAGVASWYLLAKRQAEAQPELTPTP